jgi:hypothetical protein
MSFTPPPAPSGDEPSSFLTPRKNNCAKRRETHPIVESRHLLDYEDKPTIRAEGSDRTSRPYEDLDKFVKESSCASKNVKNHEESTGPLSWNEARHRLKCTLEFWNKRQQKNRDTHSTQTKYRFVCLANLDIILAILLCVAFVVLSFTLSPHEELPSSFLLMQRIASVLFLMSSLASASILNRWAQVREMDQSIERRRCVKAFLKEMECISDRTDSSGHCISKDVIPRKNVEDVYSTFRLNDTRHRDSSGLGRGQWHRIPSLLLVKGDYIALKVGDTSPAKCQLVQNGQEKIIDAGVRLTIDLIGSNRRLPAGKSAVKAGDDLLMLANGLRVFEMLETPLETFLNKDMIGRCRVCDLIFYFSLM